MSTFAGTAEYYNKYRRGIPDELVTRLVAEAGKYSFSHSLLDIGTGTGQVLEQFLPYFRDIVAVEPDMEMMTKAKERLIPQMAEDASIFFLDGSMELVQFPPNWYASLVTFCRSFHWMDQPKVLERLDEIVEARGAIAIFSDKSFWELDNLWTAEVRKIVQSFLGEERRAGDELFHPPVLFTDSLKASRFSQIEEFTVPVKRTWSPEQILGYLYSTSFAAKPLFGDQYEDFERALFDKLHRMVPNGKFPEENEFSVIIARRPL